MEDAGNHGVGLVDQFSKRLLLIDRTQDHLVLALFADIIDTRSIDVVAWSHRRDLDSSICDALSGDKLLIQF